MLKQAYEVNEDAYQILWERGVLSWEEKQDGGKPISDELMVIYHSLHFDTSLNLLEIGCGCGDFYIFLKQQHIDVVGVDISEKAIEIAKMKATSKAVATDKLFVADICSPNIFMMFQEENFGMMLDSHTLHCIVEQSNRKRFFEHSYRLLKENGIFFISSMVRPLKVDGVEAWNSHCIDSQYIHWFKTENYANYHTTKCVGNTYYVPFRYFASQEEIFDEVVEAGFNILEYTVQFPLRKEIANTLTVVAIKGSLGDYTYPTTSLIHHTYAQYLTKTSEK